MTRVPPQRDSALVLPPSVKTAEDRLRCAIELQWKVVEKQREALSDKAGSPSWKDCQRRVAGPTPTICAMREAVFPNRCRLIDEGGTDPYQALKAAARADKRWAAELDGHQLLTAKAVPPIKIDPYEVFTAPNYTEQDVPGRIVVNDTGITVTDMSNDDEVWVVKDFGVGHFAGAYTHLVEAQATAHANDGICAFYGTATEVDDIKSNANVSCAYWKYAPALVAYVIQAKHREGGTLRSIDSSVNLLVDTWYYVTWERDGAGNITVTIRTGSHDGVEIDVLTFNDDGDARQYCFGACSYDKNVAGATISTEMRNLDLQEAAAFVPYPFSRGARGGHFAMTGGLA